MISKVAIAVRIVITPVVVMLFATGCSESTPDVQPTVVSDQVTPANTVIADSPNTNITSTDIADTEGTTIENTTTESTTDSSANEIIDSTSGATNDDGSSSNTNDGNNEPNDNNNTEDVNDTISNDDSASSTAAPAINGFILKREISIDSNGSTRVNKEYDYDFENNTIIRSDYDSDEGRLIPERQYRYRADGKLIEERSLEIGTFSTLTDYFYKSNGYLDAYDQYFLDIDGNTLADAFEFVYDESDKIISMADTALSTSNYTLEYDDSEKLTVVSDYDTDDSPILHQVFNFDYPNGDASKVVINAVLEGEPRNLTAEFDFDGHGNITNSLLLRDNGNFFGAERYEYERSPESVVNLWIHDFLYKPQDVYTYWINFGE